MPVTNLAILSQVPAETIDWLLEPDNPAVAVLARRALLGESDDAAAAALWARRNEYPPVAAILDAQLDDGSWMAPSQDYRKYQGSLWQVHLLGELWASADDPRVRAAADYAFSRQLPDGSWSASNMRPAGSIACLTSNVARALARLGWARDERVVAALAGLVSLWRELGIIDCRWGLESQLNGYCHMLTVKELLFLGEMPRDVWPEGAEALRDAGPDHRVGSGTEPQEEGGRHGDAAAIQVGQRSQRGQGGPPSVSTVVSNDIESEPSG